MSEEMFTKLRYCFQGGYTLPQFCVEKGIKKPLFVLERDSKCFLLEVHAQFRYDKRISLHQFCFIDGDMKSSNIHLVQRILGTNISVKHISQMSIEYFDVVIFLTQKMYDLDTCANRIITFSQLETFFVQRTYVDIPILHFLQRFPKVKFFLTNFPNDIRRYEGGTDFFKKELLSRDQLGSSLTNKGNHEISFDKLGRYADAEIRQLIKFCKAKENPDGTTFLIDDKYPLINIQNGKRMTAYQPEHYQNKIYFFGPCHHVGQYAPFDKTIESYLQQMLNENKLPYRVENFGQCFSERTQDMFYNLNAINPSPGDIFFYCVISAGMHSNDNVIPFCDISDAFDPPHDYKEVFCVQYHVNELGYKLVAEKYFKFLTENNFFRDKELKYPPPSKAYFHRYGIPPQFEQGGIELSVSDELDAYKQQLRTKRVQIGALVMNCNPFTLGHRYLVEYAAAKVVKLYIFVVEEDKSEFPFADRIELVRQGVKDLPNVEVLPSGKFIISQTTFSGYFSKAELQDVQVDSSEDVEIFGKEIAPTLGITVRFAGEEPKDNVTRQYNETMKRILPRYGIEFCEIPRKEFDGEPISASKVREALQAGDFDKIKNLVPITTLRYLRGRQPARIDIALVHKEQGDFQILFVSDDKAKILKPSWFQKYIKENSIGYQIQSYVDNVRIVAKVTTDGQIKFWLRGVYAPYAQDKSKLVPYWIDYTKLTINENVIFDEVTPAWHNKPYRYNLDVKAGDELKIQIEWLSHKDDE